MSAEISRSTDTVIITPDLVMPLEQSNDEPQTIVHPIIGREYPDTTLRPAAAGTGLMRLFFLDYASADQARLFHKVAATFRASSATMPWLPEHYVPTRISRVQEARNVKRWFVEIGYQEIAP